MIKRLLLKCKVVLCSISTTYSNFVASGQILNLELKKDQKTNRLTNMPFLDPAAKFIQDHHQNKNQKKKKNKKNDQNWRLT